MKRILIFLGLLIAAPLLAQKSGPFVLTATTSPCATIGTEASYATVGIRVSGTFSATLQPGVTIQGQPSTNTSVVPVGSTTSQNTITAAGAYTASVAGASTFQVCATGFVSGTATIWLNVSTGISAKAVVSSGGAVQSVTGTANQITSSGGVNPVLSLPAAIIAPGTLAITTPLGAASGGTGSAIGPSMAAAVQLTAQGALIAGSTLFTPANDSVYMLTLAITGSHASTTTTDTLLAHFTYTSPFSGTGVATANSSSVTFNTNLNSNGFLVAIVHCKAGTAVQYVTSGGTQAGTGWTYSLDVNAIQLF